jgi:hypothetical protein
MTYPRGDGRSPISSTSRGCRAGPASPGSSSTGKERSATFLASDSDRADRPSIPLSPSAGGGGTFDQAVRVGCDRVFDGRFEGVVETDTGAEGSEPWAICETCANLPGSLV